jgi:hypothetical protein
MTGRYKSQLISALLSILVTEVFCGAFTYSQVSRAVSSDGDQLSLKRRFVVVKSPANAAVAIEAVRYLEEDNWYERLEVEVRNVSGKPIYFLEVDLLFPDIVNTELDGVPRKLVLPFAYGRRNLMQKANRATPEDISLGSEESYIFKIPVFYREMKERLDVVKGILIRVYSVSFGDETGFNAGLPFSFRRE